MPSLNLQVRCDSTKWGETVAVLGSWNSWDKRQPVTMNTSATEFPLWKVNIPIPSHLENKHVEYKYVIARNTQVSSWESNDTHNRTVLISEQSKSSDVFGQIPAPSLRHNPQASHSVSQVTGHRWQASNASSQPRPSPDMSKLDPLEEAIVHSANDQRSWRQRLAFLRSLFTDDSVAAQAGFDSMYIESLVTISIYLSFLSSGQVRCDEDGGHHRPNHHAHEARQIEAALARVTHFVSVKEPHAQTQQLRRRAYIPYVVRKIFPMLPSYSSQFTVSVPLTRIRDIAHRSDIPHDLKKEIKHTLQNKLHRCAGPEDLHTSANILNRISHGGYSQPFVDQFHIFHAELQEFFNAASLDDRLRYLQVCEHTRPVSGAAGALLGLKHNHGASLMQLQALTTLREGISRLPIMIGLGAGDQNELPHEDVQKTRLVDIELESYAFLQLATEAKEFEEESSPESFPWQRALGALSLTFSNMRLSSIRPVECAAISAELAAIRTASNIASNQSHALRLKAAVDRALRFVQEFSDAIVDLFAQKAESLGRALRVDGHAINVFAEAEIRSNLTFQGSRVAAMCSTMCRRVLALPPWTALNIGEATGNVVYVDALDDVSHLENDDDEELIVVTRTADGDEDVPKRVVGVVAGRALPHLSHLGVRARQGGVVFVCAEQREAFDKIWQERRHGTCTLVVTVQSGLSKLEATGYMAKANGNTNGVKTNGEVAVSEKSLNFDIFERQVIPIAKVTRRTGASKSAVAGSLVRVSIEREGLFEAPNGAVIPHGAFHHERERHAGDFNKLVEAYSEAFKQRGDESADKHAAKIRKFVEQDFEVSDETISAVQFLIPGGKRVMVRSSANAEDLENMSGAGLYDSIANVDVDDCQQVRKAVKGVWASVWTKRAASSRMAYNISHERVCMAVLIQEMVRSEWSFVAFSRDPVGHGEDVYVEMAVGMGETLASASCDGSPFRFRIDRAKWKVDELSFGSYSEAFVVKDEVTGGTEEQSMGLTKKVVDYSQERLSNDAEWRDEVVRRIAKTVVRLEKAFKGPQDVEGAVTVVPAMVGKAGETHVHVVQARPQLV